MKVETKAKYMTTSPFPSDYCFIFIGDNILRWFVWLIRNIVVATLVWRVVSAATSPAPKMPGSSLEILSENESNIHSTSILENSLESISNGAQDDASSADNGDDESVNWKASFHYVPPPFLLSSNRKGEDVSMKEYYQPSFRELQTALHHYRQMSDGIITNLSMSHEVALRTERLLFPHHHHTTTTASTINTVDKATAPSFLSRKIEEKIAKVAELLELNTFVLESLLRPFPVSIGLSKFTNTHAMDSLLNPIEAGSYYTSSLNSKFTFPPSTTADTSASIVNQYSNVPTTSHFSPLAKYIPPYKTSNTATDTSSKNNDHRDYDLEEEPYETASHIIAHMARDWTADGATIRKDTYAWIVDQLWSHHNEKFGNNRFTPNNTCSSEEEETTSDMPYQVNMQQSPLSPVLVPGAGMGRLAFDIAFAHELQHEGVDGKSDECCYYPFAVEAIDNSIVMASAAYHVLHSSLAGDENVDSDNNQTNGKNDATNATKNARKWKIYPFVSDSFTNEVDTERRWEPAIFPEGFVIDQFHAMNHKQQSQQNMPQYPQQSNSTKKLTHLPTLSYTVGDFVTTYASPAKHGMYGSIATCFFIDTATNIYEYILTIRNLLQRTNANSDESERKVNGGGIWINVGPVQWHRNAQLQPSANELRDLIELAGFQILHWEVSEKLVAYRHPDDVDSSHRQEGMDRGEKVKGARFTRSEAYRPLKFVAVLRDDNDSPFNEPSVVHEDNEDKGNDNLLSTMEKARYLTGRKFMLNPLFNDEDKIILEEEDYEE